MPIGDNLRVNTNLAGLNTLSALKNINRSIEHSQLKLSMGVRINEVSDDIASFTIVRRLTARSRGLSVALENVGTAKNVLAIAEGGLSGISDILITMKEKVTQAASDTQGTGEREAIKDEIDQLTAEINDIVIQTKFNNISILDGTYNVSLQIGEATTDTQHFSISQSVMDTALGVASSDVSDRINTASGASIALNQINQAIDTISSELEKVGSVTSKLSLKESTLTSLILNTEVTRSRIEDTDIAREQLNSTKMQVLQQTATAQLAQANLMPQGVLALFN